MDLRPSQNLKKDHFENGVVSFLLIRKDIDINNNNNNNNNKKILTL